MKKHNIIFLFFFFSQLICAQHVTYIYDAAGNRISRTITMSGSQQRAATKQVGGTEEEQEPFLDKLGKLEIKIYPNPTRGRLAVEISGWEETNTASLKLFTMHGDLITDMRIESIRTELDISDQPAGTYLLHITIGAESVVWKIIKK